MTDQSNKPLILVTGATGYVGGRLIPKLLAQGYRVRALVRGGKNRLNGRSWRDSVEVVEADIRGGSPYVSSSRTVEEVSDLKKRIEEILV